MLKPNIHSGPVFTDLRIGLLGGSFNPAHTGHLEISLDALKRLGLDQVWWLVSPQNPLKPVEGMVPFDERMQNAEALAQAPRIIVTDIERQFNTRYTIDTLRLLKTHFPATHFVWLMGADNLVQIPRWRQWQKIMLHVPVAIFRRPGYSVGFSRGKAAQRFAPSWHSASQAKLLPLMAPPAWLVLNNRLNVTSGTALRQGL